MLTKNRDSEPKRRAQRDRSMSASRNELHGAPEFLTATRGLVNVGPLKKKKDRRPAPILYPLQLSRRGSLRDHSISNQRNHHDIHDQKPHGSSVDKFPCRLTASCSPWSHSGTRFHR